MMTQVEDADDLQAGPKNARRKFWAKMNQQALPLELLSAFPITLERKLF
jgi:hypothetical protein